MCKPGYRYPPWQYGPFLGIEIDSATQEEYERGFDCVPVERESFTWIEIAYQTLRFHFFFFFFETMDGVCRQPFETWVSRAVTARVKLLVFGYANYLIL
jgi:hypothetical protein